MRGSKILQIRNAKQQLALEQKKLKFEYKHDYSDKCFVKNLHKKPQINFIIRRKNEEERR